MQGAISRDTRNDRTKEVLKKLVCSPTAHNCQFALLEKVRETCHKKSLILFTRLGEKASGHCLFAGSFCVSFGRIKFMPRNQSRSCTWTTAHYPSIMLGILPDSPQLCTNYLSIRKSVFQRGREIFNKILRPESEIPFCIHLQAGSP